MRKLRNLQETSCGTKSEDSSRHGDLPPPFGKKGIPHAKARLRRRAHQRSIGGHGRKLWPVLERQEGSDRP